MRYLIALAVAAVVAGVLYKDFYLTLEDIAAVVVAFVGVLAALSWRSRATA